MNFYDTREFVFRVSMIHRFGIVVAEENLRKEETSFAYEF